MLVILCEDSSPLEYRLSAEYSPSAMCTYALDHHRRVPVGFYSRLDQDPLLSQVQSIHSSA